MLAPIQGNLGNEPDHRQLTNTTTTKLRVALRQSADERERQEPTTWVDVVTYGALAEGLAQLHTGDAVVLLGSWKTDTWESKDDGAKKSKTYVLAFAGGPDLSVGKRSATASTPATASDAAPAAPADPFEE